MQRWPLPTKVLRLGGEEEAAEAAEAAGASATEDTQGTAGTTDTTFAGVLRSKGAAWIDAQVNPNPNPKP